MQAKGLETSLSKNIKFDYVDKIKLNVFMYNKIKILEYLNRINNMIYHSKFPKAITSFPNLKLLSTWVVTLGGIGIS